MNNASTVMLLRSLLGIANATATLTLFGLTRHWSGRADSIFLQGVALERRAAQLDVGSWGRAPQ